MALGTIISRITGFIRGILIVAVLGTALLADTYNVANTMPNILYNLLVGGALTAIFIPQLVRRRWFCFALNYNNLIDPACFSYGRNGLCASFGSFVCARILHTWF